MSVLDMVAVGAYYQTRATYFSHPGGSVWVRALTANPLRYFARFESFAPVAGTIFVQPKEAQSAAIGPSLSNVPRETEFSKHVSQTVGEWYIFASAAITILITETVQIPK